MKIRNGFVSNSSSSSFLIAKKDISPKKIKKIKSHRIKARKVDMWCNDDEVWSIGETENYIYGSVWMDNFSMYTFMERIGVKMKKVKWSEHDYAFFREDVNV
jgi:hypothetical protein